MPNNLCVGAQMVTCVRLCNPMDCSLPGSSVCGIFQARILWYGLPLPTPWNLPNPGIEPVSLASHALAGGFFTTEPPGNIMKYKLQGLTLMVFDNLEKNIGTVGIGKYGRENGR